MADYDYKSDQGYQKIMKDRKRAQDRGEEREAKDLGATVKRFQNYLKKKKAKNQTQLPFDEWSEDIDTKDIESKEPPRKKQKMRSKSSSEEESEDSEDSDGEDARWEVYRDGRWQPIAVDSTDLNGLEKVRCYNDKGVLTSSYDGKGCKKHGR
jgi:hypothetical protein